MREYLRYERFAAEAITADRDRAVKGALKAGMPIFEVAKEFELSDAEVGKIIASQGPPRHDAMDVKDARDEKPKIVIPGRR